MAKLDTLQNKVVWITGASSGLGKALAGELALQGAKLILTSRRFEELEEVRVGLLNPDHHLSVVADITDEKQVQEAYKQILKAKGRIDWLINNAGLSQRALIQDTTMATERAIMEVDYFSQVALTKTVLPTMLKQKSGRVVFVSSVAGLLGTQYRASYSAAKAAIHMWANSLRAEVSDQGVEVSVIFPGFVKTNVSFNALNGAGQPQGHQDEAIENGLEADVFAEQAVKALVQGQEYIVVGGAKEKLGVMVSRMSPKLLYKMIRKTKVK
ncbi:MULTISPECIES: SDR family NAD(P)-dependent oxidoreductase [Acinetobacter]|jgi:short-subunit dehydrogenase|uniref:SDR family NAD(P)-dependent oxidoreductase n=1 Tax=Acinetobacter pittii TaxID=48296 RepID=A0AAE9M9R7_ACIPI|nr:MULTISPECIES: SDR family NAD(P)-dependent oxidoreductase [Acinetobacter calcoaceticus/baumannii complex]AZP28314.1 KR domain-containing protein [Acinetobacter pittii]EXC28786.1 short chain dehydrogenase family protein [Acinetobacter sp. 809848]EXE26873.1 short chain dehydrogenase family protein [Acinetobacter sp. 907131]EXS15587.1 short chain dehydrogenase family protein [Acinetobacter sp. 883425]MBK0411055.1 SDR family NAD(P)-dependent oxidoreductase [Acinetobacter pittii]